MATARGVLRAARTRTSILGGHATPLHFLKMPLQYADHALDVWHRVASRVQKTYGLSSKSNATSCTYSSSAGAMSELIEVTCQQEARRRAWLAVELYAYDVRGRGSRTRTEGP